MEESEHDDRGQLSRIIWKHVQMIMIIMNLAN